MHLELRHPSYLCLPSLLRFAFAVRGQAPERPFTRIDYHMFHVCWHPHGRIGIECPPTLARILGDGERTSARQQVVRYLICTSGNFQRSAFVKEEERQSGVLVYRLIWFEEHVLCYVISAPTRRQL
jgi:hypothetical protein